MLEDNLARKALAYAAQRRLRLAEPLGFGIHGTVMAAEDKAEGTNLAIKAHRSAEFNRRERCVYQRLQGRRVTQVLGFHVQDVSPSNIGFSD